MSTTFRPYAPDQSLLLPPDVREWLPEGHLAHHISDLVDDLDLTAFYAPYEGDGRRNAPYEPRMMVKVLLYAYATGVFSSRRVARRLEEDVAFRVLAAGNFPQHRTLCEFRRRHLEDFQALFVEVVRLAQELGLARLGKLSIDGTKVRANASKRKAMSYDRMQEEEQRLESEIEALLRKADAVDEAEDARLGAEVRGDDLPAELHRREARLAAIRAAKARLEAKQRAADDARGRQPGQDRNPKGGRPYKRAYGEPDEKAQSNFTDPESSIMKTSSEGFQQCYNAQAAVDAEHQLVVATDLTANASDQGELPVLLDAVKETFDAQPETVLADAGYCNERDLKDLEKRGVDGYVAPGRGGQAGGYPRSGGPSGDGSHDGEAGDAGGPDGVCGAQVVVGGSLRLDQARAGLPALQFAWTGEGALRVGPGVPGVERQAPARADGGVGCGECGSPRRQIDAHRGLWRPVRPARTEFCSLFSNHRKSTPPGRPAKPPRHGAQGVGWRPVSCRKRPAAQTPRGLDLRARLGLLNSRRCRRA